MHFLALLPYLIIGVGLVLGQAGLRPAMLAWGVCMFGALSGLAVAITILVIGQTFSWMLAAVSIIPVAATLIMVVKDLSYPHINDVATDLDNPIAFVAALRAPTNADRDMTYPETFKPQVRKAYPQIQPLILDELADQVFERVSHIVKNRLGWRVTHHDTRKKTVEAEAMTPLLGFVDDVIVRVSNHEGKSWVDMRSKSREGLVDAGKNAKRIETFLEQVKQSEAGNSARSLDHSDTQFASTQLRRS